VQFHPTRPVLITTSEDKITYVWSTLTFKRENAFDAHLERGWALAISEAAPIFAAGHDRGVIVAKFVQTGVPIALDGSGKIMAAHGCEVAVATIRQIGPIIDGTELTLNWREAIATETPPVELIYSPNGKHMVTVSDGEWNIYGSLGFRSKAFGKGLKFAWASTGENFAVLDAGFTVTVYGHNFEKRETIQTYARRIWGGELLAASVNSGLEFYDWEQLRLLRRIEAKPSEVKWFEDLVAIRTKDAIFILEFNRQFQEDWVKETGFADAFTIVHKIEAKSSSLCWFNGVLFFTENIKINRFIGGIVQTTSTLKCATEILGYLPRENLLVLVGPQRHILGITFPEALLQFEADVAAGEEPNPDRVPEQYKSRCAKFLKQIGRTVMAMEMTTDSNVRFDLALELGRLDIAQESATDPSMWRRLARAALAKGKIDLALLASRNCGDLATLLLLLKGTNRADELSALVDEAERAGQFNVAFTGALLTGQKRRGLELLLKSQEYAKAALFARAHVPEMTSACVKLWREHLQNKKIAEGLADPGEYPGLFDELLGTVQ
jgi:coatomer subunit beta'